MKEERLSRILCVLRLLCVVSIFSEEEDEDLQNPFGHCYKCFTLLMLLYSSTAVLPAVCQSTCLLSVCRNGMRIYEQEGLCNNHYCCTQQQHSRPKTPSNTHTQTHTHNTRNKHLPGTMIVHCTLLPPSRVPNSAGLQKQRRVQQQRFGGV